jgi:transposase InsO family protein
MSPAVQPRVRELANDNIDVAVAGRVLNVSRSGYWYNPNRRHSSLGMHSPITFERLHTGPDQDR